MARISAALCLPYSAEIRMFYTTVSQSRYLKRPHQYSVVRNRNWNARIDCIHQLPERDFKRKLRVSYQEFHSILDLIKDSNVFISQGPRKQAPPLYQLTVALYRFGHEGNSCNAYEIGHNFDISEGSSLLWTYRVIEAFMGIEDQVVVWPDERGRSCIANTFDEERLPGGCVGVMDGCLIPFAIKPPRPDASDFFSYKSRYGFSILAVCDDKMRITFAQYGFPASCHDARVYNSSILSSQSHRFFAPGQYVVADSAFPVGDHCISLFKTPRNAARLGESERVFNQRAAGVRVSIEHTFGILKSRWQSLRGLRLLIRDRFDEGIASCWIRSCVILHNLLIATGEWYISGEGDEMDREDAEYRRQGQGQDEEERILLQGNGPHRRHQVMDGLSLEPTIGG